MNVNNQVKSKQRVSEHGEVFTAEREVKAMCDLVNDECLNINSRFLEPACGEGNFLVEILSRRLNNIKYDEKYELNSLIALSNLYGIDILPDNVKKCRENLFNKYLEICGANCSDEIKKAAEYILSRNIVCGDALKMKMIDENHKGIKKPIVFTDWEISKSHDYMIIQNNYRLEDLLNNENPYDGTLSLNFEFRPKEKLIKTIKELLKNENYS